ncbi:MAG: hypothetical protein WKF88_03920 [Ferruginibacter sp.]
MVFILLNFFACLNSDDYKVGNRITLDYPIKTKISFKVIRKYLDTLIMTQGYNVPQKWTQYDKLIDIDSTNAKRLYFRNLPEEMYLIQFNGELLLADIYNENIVRGDWVATPERMPQKEEARVKKRFREEILDAIEKLAKKNGVPDSILYYKPI